MFYVMRDMDSCNAEAGSSDWAITPPSSPKGLVDAFSQPELFDVDLQENEFHCLGQCNPNDRRFHEKGFLRANRSNKKIVEQGRIRLFGKLYQFHDGLQNKSDELFNFCRKEFMKLYSSIDRQGCTLATKFSSNDCAKFRTNISTFLHYVLNFVRWSSYSSPTFKEIIKQLNVHIQRLRLLCGRLGVMSLPDYILAHYASAQGERKNQPSLYLIHSFLDIRWLMLNILRELHSHPVQSNDVLSQIVTYDVIQVNIEEYIQLTISELVWISISKYDRTDGFEMSCFSCVCIKEFWVLLRFFLDDWKSSEGCFWQYVNQILTTLLEITESTPITPDCRSLNIPQYYQCSNRPGVALWLLANLAELNKYGKYGDYYPDDVTPNYEQLENILKHLLTSDLHELELRKCLPLILSLFRMWKYSKHEPVIMLWEFFYKRLNSAFYIPGSKLDSCAVSCKTGSSLLEQVKLRFASHQDKNESSFSMFLKILGTHLMKCKKNNISYQKICGRIFIKFPDNRIDKLLELSEFGLYHLSSLFLTLAFTTDVEDMALKLQQLLCQLPAERLTPAKLSVVWKSFIASVLIVLENDTDASKHITLMLNELKSMLELQDENITLTVMPIFIDGLRHMINIDNICLSQYLLFGPWICEYLKVASVCEISRLFSTVLLLIQKLRKPSSFFNLESGTQINKIKQNLIDNLFPYLNVHLTPHGAELAGELTMLGSASDLNSMFQQWTSCDDVTTTKRYLCYLASHGFLEQLNVENCEFLIIQGWIKCCIFTVEDSVVNVNPLIKSVMRLPRVQQLSESTGLNLISCDDPLYQFISSFKLAYTKCQTLVDKSNLRELFSNCFSKLDKWISDEIKKCSKDILDNIYKYCGAMFEYCFHLIYTKSNPKSILKTIIDQIILPPAIFKKEFKLSETVLECIRKYLHLFINGLLNLGPKSDPFIGRCLRDVVTHYIPVLSNTIEGTNCRIQHPLKKCMTDINTTSTLVEIIVNSFVNVRGKLHNPNARKALNLLQEILEDFDETTYDILLNYTLPAVLEFVMFCEDNTFKQTALCYLSSLITSAYCNDIRSRQCLKALESSCRKNLAFNTLPWFRLAATLIPISPQLVKEVLPCLLTEIENVEKRRGVERDSGLRKSLVCLKEKLEKQIMPS